MPNPTIYLTDSEAEWIETREDSRSGVIRTALQNYMEQVDAAELESNPQEN